MTPIRTPHQLSPNVKLLQKVVVRWRGKFLMLQRDAASFSRPNQWDFPGGNSEWPDDVTEPTANLHQRDASREVFEEAGIRLDPAGFTFDRLIYLETFYDPRVQIFTTLLGWQIDLPDDFDPESVRLSEEHVAYRWLPLTEALALDFGGERGVFMVRILRAVQ
jgi:8-oxo-dGTP pyrophosphatase MutT (NUDIX family)